MPKPVLAFAPAPLRILFSTTRTEDATISGSSTVIKGMPRGQNTASIGEASSGLGGGISAAALAAGVADHAILLLSRLRLTTGISHLYAVLGWHFSIFFTAPFGS